MTGVRPSPGTVLVPGVLVGSDGSATPCPAADLLAGEIRRRGLRAVRTADDLPTVTARRPALAATCAEADRHTVEQAVAAVRAVAAPREIVLASPRSFCAGVERAVDIVERALALRGAPVYVRRQIVHNAHVVADLEARGVVFVDELDAVPDGATVVFSAHGVAPQVRSDAVRRGLDVIDATCPLVAKVHNEARRFAARGDTVLLIGHAGHDEVEGTLGQTPGRIRLVEDIAQAGTVRVADPSRVSYLTQTTLAVDETSAVVDALRSRFPALAGPDSDDICYATTNRQEAVAAIAPRCDLVLVVGSANSSNSQRLVEVARRAGTVAHLVDDAAGVLPEWLGDARTVGMTAGASAPHHLVDGVVAALGGLGTITVTEHRTSDETLMFVLPPALREPCQRVDREQDR